MNRYAVGLGSNLGDRLEHLVSAIAALDTVGEVVAVSALYETEPVGGPEQDPFLNAVALVDTDLQPLQLLDRLHEMEHARGRERGERWGPRTLDLDLVAWDSGPISGDRLTLPHPRASDRGFVLRPLCDVWPEASVPGGVTAEVALASVGAEGVDLLARNWVPPVSPWPGRMLVMTQFILLILAAVGLASDGSLPQGEVTVLGVTGAALASFGLVMALVASRRLGPALTANPTPKQGASLIIVGPYRYVRHPIYGGVLFVLLGTAMFLGSLWGGAVAVALLVFFRFKAAFEERQLRMAFAGYRAYQAVVHRRLIPFLL